MEPIGILPPQEWLTAPATCKIMNALKSESGSARFVGGCVRDSLLSRPIHDIDIAVTYPPEKVMKLLKEAQIKAIPVGLAHGTVLALHDDQTFHITTLRADLETDGRRAKVEFIDNWQADAQRRDFTMNALYADLDGTFYDPYDGLKDLKAGKVVFIGNPSERIQEDYLRILRFFRFQSYYGQGEIDLKALEACTQHKQGLRTLSGERIWSELNRLLMAKDPVACLQSLKQAGIWSTLFEGAFFPQKALVEFGILIERERELAVPAHDLRRLAILVKPIDLKFIAHRLRFSSYENIYLETLIELVNSEPDLTFLQERNRLLYRYGTAIFLDLSLVLGVKTGAKLKEMQNWVEEAALWIAPLLPLKGRDLLQLQLVPGPLIGVILKELEEWWIDHNFQPDRKDCLAWVRTWVRVRMEKIDYV